MRKKILSNNKMADSNHVWTNLRGYGEIRVNDLSLVKQDNRHIFNRIPSLPSPSFTYADRSATWSTPNNSPYWKRALDFYGYQVN